jgi:hypothetical protein
MKQLYKSFDLTVPVGEAANKIPGGWKGEGQWIADRLNELEDHGLELVHLRYTHSFPPDSIVISAPAVYHLLLKKT